MNENKPQKMNVMKKIKVLILGIISLLFTNSETLVAQFDQPGFFVHSDLTENPSLLFFNLGFDPGDLPVPFPPDQNNRFEVYGDRIYISNEGRGTSGNYINNILIYDNNGTDVGNVVLPAEMESCLDFVVLPDLKFALLDNIEDKVYIIDNSGSLLETVDMINAPAGRSQNVDGVVAGNSLIILENGNLQVLKIDLGNYNVSIFRDLSGLPGNNIGSIDYYNGRFYVGSTDESGRYIYSFIEGQPEDLIATIPYEPYYITSIKVFDNYIYACINYEFKILKIDISTGDFTVFYEAPAGTFYPSDIEGINLTSYPSPMAASVAATDVSITSAGLNGIVNANDISTTVSFEYWTENSEISSSPATPSPVTGAGSTAVSSDITGLDAGTTYYFRIKAESTQGIAYSDVLTFRTYKDGAVKDIDNNYYNVVTIGTQTWITENLKVTRLNDGTIIDNVTGDAQWVDLTTPGFCWYNNGIVNKETYGALYNWYVLNTGSLCPTGWHVPDESDWTELESFLGGTLVAGSKLKEAGTSHWPDNLATGESGFLALPGGGRYVDSEHSGQFEGNPWYGYFWSSTEDNYDPVNNGVGRYMINNDIRVERLPYSKKSGFSVRCIKDISLPIVTTNPITNITPVSAFTGGTVVTDGGAIYAVGICWSISESPTDEDNQSGFGPGVSYFTASATNLDPDTKYYLRAYAINKAGIAYGNQLEFTTTHDFGQIIFNDGLTYGTVTDIDGNPYKTVQIGSQVWMAENLKTKRLNDGTPIPEITGNADWSNQNSLSFCWYKNSESTYKAIFGALYNWYAVNTGKLCPIGWYVPGGFPSTALGAQMKEVGTTHWPYPNSGATNETGFTSIPGGYRNLYGEFELMGDQAYWWTATRYNNPEQPNSAYFRYQVSSDDGVHAMFARNVTGFSVRCVKNVDPTIVTNTNDIGIGSLRNAIEYANSTVNVKETITFNIPGPGPFVIQPLTQLPAIADPVIIDGYSQPGALPATDSEPATILIEINGSALGSATGLNLDAGNSTLSGLFIRYFRVNLTLGGTGKNTIKGNYFAGTVGTINNIYVNSPDNEIGGRSPAARNVITSAGAGDGIEINNTNGHLVGRNRIIGNFIGIDPTGEIKLGNDFAGISIVESPENIIGGSDENERNVISGNIVAISISGVDATGNRIEGNYIGTNAEGTGNIGNDTGISVNAPGNVIGGSTPGAGNLISGNGGPGGGYTIRLREEANGNIILGNMIGTDRTGFKAIPNQLGDVIYIRGGDNNLIGGLLQGARNIISGNQENAVRIEGTEGNEAEGNKIQGNYIGTDLSGKAALGNGMNGIVFGNYANDNVIGGVEPGAGNIIAFNEGAGVTVGGTTNPATGNSILTNSIHSNGGLGIDLGGVGITPNDSSLNETLEVYEYDLDDGPNNLQNFPVIKSITYSRNEVTITGSLRTNTNTEEYNIQFFANKLGDGSGYGEGQTYLGSIDVLPNSYGIAPFSVTFPRSTSAEVFTATATDPARNTSEFSMAIGGLAGQELSPGKFSYQVNGTGVPNVPALNVEGAVDASFLTWSNVMNESNVKTADISFTDGGTTTEEHASNDGINLVTFTDNEYDIPWGVLAIAAKTWHVDQQTSTAQILDADIVVNPFFVTHPTYDLGIEGEGTYDGYFDIQSLITHEIGHVLGLLHSGLINSTMWFQIGEGTSVRDLTQDDKSWASYRYPTDTYNGTFGSISGNITYGYDGQPVAGAFVQAILVGTTDTIHSYSDAEGNYLVPGLIPGSYNIFIEPLDGDVNGEELWPGNISEYIGSNIVYLDYPDEYYSSDESADEVNDTPVPIVVSAGSTSGPCNLVSNKDNIPPTVELVKPTLTSGNLVNVLSNFNIRFSESVDMTTLTGATCFLSSVGTTETVPGSVTKPYSEYPSTVLFDPATDLKHDKTYTLHLTTGVMDLRGNNLEKEYTQVFTTVSLDETAPSINEVIPADDSINVFISSTVKLIFSEPMNMTSVEEGFTLTWTEESTTNTVDGSFSWRDYNKMVIFTPSGYLKEGTLYTISVSEAVMDLSANQMGSSKSFSFTTVGVAAPVILYLGPSGDNVTINTPVVVDFSEPINTSSVNSTTFKLLPGLNPDVNAMSINGTYEFFNENSTVVFRPLADLTEFTDYTIILTDGITDVSQPNSSLAKSETTFKTADKVTEPSISYLDPTYGVAGNAVTIAGAGFDPNPAFNTVIFNGTQAVITKAYLTSLEVVVPAEAHSGPVTVTVNNKISNSRNFDIYTEILDPAGYATANAPIGIKSTHGSDVTPEGAFAYVTNPEEGTVSVVDMNTLDVETIVIGEGKYPLMIDINPEGTKAYVTNFYSSDVSVIDLEPGDNYNTVIKSISVGIGPWGVAVTPDGQRVYVANYYSGSLSMIDADPASGGYDHATSNIPIGKNPTVTKANPDGALVIVVGDFGLMIINSDPSNKDDYNTATVNIPIGKKVTAATTTPEGAYAIVSTDDGYLLLIDLYPESGDYSDAVVANVKAGCDPSDIKARGDNAYVYLTDTDGDRIIVYKTGVGGTGSTGSSMPSGLGMTLVYETEIPVGDAPQSLVIDADRLYVVDGDPSEPEVRRVTVIQFGLLSLSNGFSDLIKAIQGMIDAGDIKPVNGKNIIKKLEDARKYIDAGKTKNALNSLNAAGNMIKALMNSHQITADQGNYLLNLLNLIIAEIDNSKKSGEIEYYNVDLEQPASDLIAETKLGIIYPNPTKDAITINYEIAENEMGSEKVTIQIYDVIGRLVSNLVNENMVPGRYTAIWNGNFDNGEMASRGYYFVRLSAGKTREVKQIMLVR